MSDWDKLNFETFGVLCKQQAFSKSEMQDITSEFDKLMGNGRDGEWWGERGKQMWPLVELSPKLISLAEDDRIYGTVERLLGPDFIWAGSEGNVNVNYQHRWHSDRPGEHQLDYKRVKIMFYLDSLTADSGALRVMPGSHRMPMHMDLFELQGLQDDPEARPFGVDASELPGMALESEPGDVVFFNQSLYHAMFNGWPGRRYFALKYAQTPKTSADVKALHTYAGGVFDVHDSFRNNKSARIQGMVERLDAAPKS